MSKMEKGVFVPKGGFAQRNRTIVLAAVEKSHQSAKQCCNSVGECVKKACVRF
jgi:hypothetical protein